MLILTIVHGTRDLRNIKPIINRYIDFIEDEYASALIAWGSEVLGNDDELSKDHE